MRATPIKTVGFAMLALGLALAGCVPFSATTVTDSAIASCVSQAGFAQGTVINVDRAFRPDGMDARVKPSVDIDAAAARRVNACLETAVMGRSVKYADSAVSQTVETSPDGQSKRVTYTYGSPRASAPAYRAPVAGASCSLQMMGGSGYACVPN